MTPERAPLDQGALNRELNPPWQIEVVSETASTNTDLLAAAAAGAPEGRVLVAEYQHAGRGRLDRSWASPAGAGLTFSLLVRPTPELADWGWLPLLTGLALARAVDNAGSASLKWPNDVLLGPEGRKLAGILVQASGRAAVIGVGVNVTTSEAELPVPTATSLRIEGIELSREAVLASFLAEFERLYHAWSAAGGDAVAAGLADEYRARCDTLGRRVELQFDSQLRQGEAVDVDAEARLLVRLDGESEVRPIAAGDVTHVRSNHG